MSEEPAVEPATIPPEAARLYDQLRDYARANDQEGVRRVFAELVRAQRPISEISGVVESLSKNTGNATPETETATAQPSSQLHAEPESEQSIPEPADPQPDELLAAALDHNERDLPAVPVSVRNPPGLDEELGSDPGSELEQRAPETRASQPEDWPATSSSELESFKASAVAPSETATSPTAVPPPQDQTRARSSSKRVIIAVVVSMMALAGAGVFLWVRSAGKEATAVLPANSDSAAARLNSVGVRATAGQDTPSLPVAPTSAPPVSEPPVALPAPDGHSATASEKKVPGPQALTATTASALPPNTAVPSVAGGPAADQPTLPAESKDIPAAQVSSARSAPAANAVATSPGPSADRSDAKPTTSGAEPESKTAVVPPQDPDRPAAAAAPALSVTAPSASASPDQPELKSALASLEPTKPPSPTASAEPSASLPAAPATAVPERGSKDAPTPAPETAALLERGDRLFGVGDIASARLFYERAAEAGNAQAALRLGETYDPDFLERAQLRVQGDRVQAVFWYHRARALGASEAEILLKGAQAK